MKHQIKYILCICLAAFAFASCDKDETPIVPNSIKNLSADTRAGQIILRWDSVSVTDPTIDFIRVTYFDPKIKKNSVRLASIYADSILIPDTRARYGEYTFTVNTVSPTNTLSADQTIKMTSAPAERTITYAQGDQIALTAADLSTNAQESSEGPIANLIDNNTATFFHSQWSGSVPAAPHWIAFNLNKTLTSCKFFFSRRTQNNANRPIDFDLMGSTDGNNWFQIRNFANPADGLPTDASINDYTSPVVVSEKPFSHLKVSVNKTSGGTVFFTFSEFKIWGVTVSVIDPEVDEVEID